MDIDQSEQSEYEVTDFGWWPEIFGAIGVIALIGTLIATARGMM